MWFALVSALLLFASIVHPLLEAVSLNNHFRHEHLDFLAELRVITGDRTFVWCSLNLSNPPS